MPEINTSQWSWEQAHCFRLFAQHCHCPSSVGFRKISVDRARVVWPFVENLFRHPHSRYNNKLTSARCAGESFIDQAMLHC